MTDVMGRARRSGRSGATTRIILAAVIGVLTCSCVLLLSHLASAQRPDGGASASADAFAADADATVDPAVTRLRELASDVRALIDGRLAVEVAPQTLFDVPLDDAAAIGLEAARLTALVREVDDAKTRAPADATAKRARRDAAAGADAARDVSPALWQARVDLDRARLAFYALSDDRRRELLASHARRALESAPDVDPRTRDAEARRQLALKAVNDARSEAERLVSEEYARLLDVEGAQAAFAEKLTAQGQSIAARREATLVWERRAREARAADAEAEADRTYDELRTALLTARDDLGLALDEASSKRSMVPQAGADPLADLRTAVDTTAAREERARLDASAERLAAKEKTLREERASQLLDELGSLNAERLAMLPVLSPDKRSSVTGFTAAGAAQAAAELRQLGLIARYHRYAATSWLSSLRYGREGLGLTVGAVVLVAIEWLVVFAAFVWLIRRTPAVLRNLRKRARDDDRRARLTAPSPATRAFAFAFEIHRPVEWLGLALLLSWLVPASARGLLEVQLVTVMVQWILGGSLVVVVVNALAGADHGLAPDNDTSALRLRSLRLVGRVIVAFGLVLVLTSRLVGPGTIYQWVLSTCWLASIPVSLLLVRWWREVVFRRAERSRRKDAFECWVLANRAGWKSFLAATGGGVYLFTRGAWRAGRSWASRFRLTRTVLAYLFRRELDKLEAERAELATGNIPEAAFDALGPEAPRGKRIVTDSDEPIDRLRARLNERRGGTIALVGSFGMGKTVLLRELHEAFPDTRLVTFPDGGDDTLARSLGEGTALPPDASLEAAAEAASASSSGRAILLDDAHRFVRPYMGGLATFDELFAAASRHSKTTTWVFALDEALWLFLKRARGARPLFDDVIRLEPWREEQIVEVLTTRTAAAGLHPSFEHLLEKLPPNADEIDKQEALERRAASYYRLLWDYAAGNPGIALHMWRSSLGADAAGGAHVRFFQAPETDDLELLPDEAVFVLRAVLQLAPATPDEIGRATMLSTADIVDALRYAEARAYVSQRDGRYRITWTWFRAVALFLQRRHLLATP